MGVRDWLREYDAEGPALMAAPILLVPLYVYLSDAWSQWKHYTDIAALIVLVAIGLAGVWLLPTSRLRRGLISPVYAAVTVFSAAIWAIAYRGGL